MSEREVIARTGDRPITRPQLVADLLRLGVRPGMNVLVHSSLSSLGWVVGGAETLLRSLEDAVGPAGTLLMPAFSLSAPEPSRWSNPPVPEGWWETIRRYWPPFDVELTPTRRIGTVAELFRHQPGTMRSHHPCYSFCARGPEASYLLAMHPLDFGLGARSPLDRLYDLDGKVLLLGVDHGSNTSLHLAEFRSRWKGREKVVHFEGQVMRQGRVARVRFRDLDSSSDDFAQLGADFERETSSVHVGPVGVGEGRFMDQRALVDFGFEWLPKHRGAQETVRERPDSGPAKVVPRYQMKPPSGFADEGRWQAAKRRGQRSRIRRT